MMLAFLIGAGWIAATALVCTFNHHAHRTPTPRPDADDLTAYRQRRQPRRPTSIT